MKNENISRVLKYYRKLNRMHVNEVVEKLTEYRKSDGLSPKTIYGWENGTSQPNADTLLFLCKLYHIDNILETFGYPAGEKETPILTDTEQKLLSAFRAQPEMQDAVHRLLGLK